MNPALRGITSSIVSAITMRAQAEGHGIERVREGGNSAMIILTNGDCYKWRVGNPVTYHTADGRMTEIDVHDLFQNM